MANFILFVTFLAIVWYSWETRKLGRVTAKHLTVEIEPIIAVEDIDGFYLRVKNIGRNPALNIKIQEIKNRRCLGSNDSYDISFEGSPHFLRPNVDTGIHMNFKSGSVEHLHVNPDPFLDYRNPNFVDGYEIIINYNDIEMGRWETKTSIDKNGVHFKGIREIR